MMGERSVGILKLTLSAQVSLMEVRVLFQVIGDGLNKIAMARLMA